MTPHLNGPWRPIYDAYEINQAGMIRRRKSGGNRKKGFVLKPGKGATVKAVYMLMADGKRIQASAASLLLQVWGIDVKLTDEWRLQAQEVANDHNRRENSAVYHANKNKSAEIRRVRTGYKRHCHDCGTPTDQYRCDACWLRLRGEPDSDYRAEYGRVRAGGRQSQAAYINMEG
jgi:hypothetical protein